MYARIENNVVVEWPIPNLQQRYPQTSFSYPITKDQFPEGIVYVNSTPPPSIEETQEAIPDIPVFENNIWQLSWRIRELNFEEIEQKEQNKAIMQRQLRAEAYRNESDPLFFQEQRGEIPEGTWLAKVEEIKQRYSS